MGVQDVALLPSRASFSTTHFLESVVEVKASGPPHVLELWLGLSKVMLPVTCGRGEGLRTTSCLRTVVGVKQGHAPCNLW